MKQKQPTNSKCSKDIEFDEIETLVELQVKDGTPQPIITAIAKQLLRLSESARRIEEEGVVVRDLKGSVIQHPAIKIEQDSTKLIADLFMKFRSTRKYTKKELEERIADIRKTIQKNK